MISRVSSNYLKKDKPIIVPQEGCLSIPDMWTPTKRYREVTVKSLGEDGELLTQEFSEFLAIIVQHEVDHMNGIVNTQRKYFPPEVAGRNERCPCGSGKKYKKCCIEKLVQPEVKEIKP